MDGGAAKKRACLGACEWGVGFFVCMPHPLFPSPLSPPPRNTLTLLPSQVHIQTFFYVAVFNVTTIDHLISVLPAALQGYVETVR